MENLLHRREGIIITLIEVINELGLQGLSTREVAKRQGVSEATLFRHFKNKNHMLLAVLDYFCQYDDDIIQASINKRLKPVEAVRYFICEYAEYYGNYPCITAILQSYDGLMCEPELRDKLRDILTKRTSFVQDNIKKAQKEGVISENVDSGILCTLIMGGLKEACLDWRISNYSYPLKDRVMSMVDMLLEAFSRSLPG